MAHPLKGASAFYAWTRDDGDEKLTLEERMPFQYVKRPLPLQTSEPRTKTYTLEATPEGRVLTMDKAVNMK